MKSYKKGFTLLEILVVITIVVSLAAIISPNLMQARSKARDAKRKTDIKAISDALEQYYASCGYRYPTPATGNKFTNITCTLITPTIMIMPTAPVDPQSITPTPYVCNSCTSTSYSICATMESESPSSYCISNQQ